MKNGVSDYLLKPVKYEDLSDCLTRIRETLDMEKGLAQPEEENLSYYEKLSTLLPAIWIRNTKLPA